MGNTRTDYAVMGKIVREPSIHILGENKSRLFGTISGTTVGPFLDHIGPILSILDLFYLVLGRGRPPGPYRLRLGRDRPPGPYRLRLGRDRPPGSDCLVLGRGRPGPP